MTTSPLDDPLLLRAVLPELEVPGPHPDLLDRLTEVARWLPDSVALDAADGSLTYAQLARRVRQLADELGALDALAGAPGQPVGIYAEQGTDSTAALFAAASAGHPAVFLDVLLPAGRIAAIAEIAGLTVVLADESHRAAAAEIPGVQVRSLLPAEPAALPGARVPVELGSPASIVFTSGTTGLPKGVVYTHRTVLASAANGRVTMRVTPADRVALVLPEAFAAGQLTLFAGLFNGATVCVRDPRVHGLADLAEWVRRSRITLLVGTPSLVRALDSALPDGEVLPDLRLVVTCGEKVYGRDVAAFRDHLRPDAGFLNWLGSSETEAISGYEVRGGDPVPPGVVPAGWPVPLRTIEVLGDDGTPLPAGEVGLLTVTSAHMSAGYWAAPEVTAEKFQLLPDGRTRYRTGDRARIDEHGCLHVLGRADDSVKIRGYLVEPGEVEAALLALPQVRDAVVRAVTGADDAPRLVAWVVPEPAARTTTAALLRAALAATLPDWMLPRDVVLLDALPRTERGKVAIASLPAVPERPEPGPLTTDAERAVAQIWTQVLHLDRVGPEESFTALGGDSLAVEEMLTTVHRRLGVGLMSGDLAEHPTLGAFAALVEAGTGTGSHRRSDGLVVLRATGTRPPLFCLAGAGGAAAAFEPLAAALGPDQPVYGVQAHGLENRGVPDWTVRRAARRYVRLIEREVPAGPVQLAGHSMGGLLALAVAERLVERGYQVLEVFLLDTFLPLPARPDDAPRRVGPESTPLSRRELWRTRLRVLSAGVVRYPPEVQKEVFHQHGARVVRWHRPVPWPGRALVVLSSENEDSTAWWTPLLPGVHAVHRVRADHLAMLRRPFVDSIAELMAAELDVALRS